MQDFKKISAPYGVWIAKTDGDSVRPIEHQASYDGIEEALWAAGKALRGIGGTSLQAQNRKVFFEGTSHNCIVIHDPDGSTPYCTAIVDAVLLDNDGCTKARTPSEAVPAWNAFAEA
jgi:hypothetical protein